MLGCTSYLIWPLRGPIHRVHSDPCLHTCPPPFCAQEAIPWDALQFLIGQLHYGGRVTDELDRRCLAAVLGQFVSPAVVAREGCMLGGLAAMMGGGEGCSDGSCGGYAVPADAQGIDTYRDYLRGLPRWGRVCGRGRGTVDVHSYISWKAERGRRGSNLCCVWQALTRTFWPHS